MKSAFAITPMFIWVPLVPPKLSDFLLNLSSQGPPSQMSLTHDICHASSLIDLLLPPQDIPILGPTSQEVWFWRADQLGCNGLTTDVC